MLPSVSDIIFIILCQSSESLLQNHALVCKSVHQLLLLQPDML